MASLLVAGGVALTHQVQKYRKERKEKKQLRNESVEEMQAENHKIESRRQTNHRGSLHEDMKTVPRGLYDTSRPGSSGSEVPDEAPPSYDEVERSGAAPRRRSAEHERVEGVTSGERAGSAPRDIPRRSMVDAIMVRKSTDLSPSDRVATRDMALPNT